MGKCARCGFAVAEDLTPGDPKFVHDCVMTLGERLAMVERADPKSAIKTMRELFDKYETKARELHRRVDALDDRVHKLVVEVDTLKGKVAAMLRGREPRG
jgi:hypothetical protein